MEHKISKFPAFIQGDVGRLRRRLVDRVDQNTLIRPFDNRQAVEHGVAPDVQDTGVTFSFQPSNGRHYQKIEDTLRDLDKSKVVHFSPQEMRSMESQLEREQGHDQMAVNFHGMHFHFNRDQAPSHWSAHEAPPESASMPSIPELAYYGVPLLL